MDDTLQPKLYRISTYEYYGPNCSTHFEFDDLPWREANTV